MKDENGSWSWLRHSMSNLSYREACNFNKARGNNPQGLAKRKRDVHSLPCSQCGLLLPSSLKLWSLAEKERTQRPTFCTCSTHSQWDTRAFSPHIRHPLGFLQDSTNLMSEYQLTQWGQWQLCCWSEDHRENRPHKSGGTTTSCHRLGDYCKSHLETH